MVVDNLKLGEGAAEGGVKGIVTDIGRALAIVDIAAPLLRGAVGVTEGAIGAAGRELNILGKKKFPMSLVPGEEAKIINEVLAERNIEMGIRAGAPQTALGSRILAPAESSGLPLLREISAKPLGVEQKSTFGFLRAADKEGKMRWFRTDFDPAWARYTAGAGEVKAGTFLSNQEVIELGEEINQRLIAAGRPASFMHGSHFTALGAETPLGVVDVKKYLKIGSPGAVTVFDGTSVRTMKPGEVYEFAIKHNLPWMPQWKMPWSGK